MCVSLLQGNREFMRQTEITLCRGRKEGDSTDEQSW